jgi:hypothetical protein
MWRAVYPWEDGAEKATVEGTEAVMHEKYA